MICRSVYTQELYTQEYLPGLSANDTDIDFQDGLLDNYELLARQIYAQARWDFLICLYPERFPKELKDWLRNGTGLGRNHRIGNVNSFLCQGIEELKEFFSNGGSELAEYFDYELPSKNILRLTKEPPYHRQVEKRILDRSKLRSQIVHENHRPRRSQNAANY
jgi:hypothetical protein